MRLIDEILQYRSVSIVGLEKNTGKTETLNFILRNLADTPKCVAITSIGIDGETTDLVTRTPKPEITVFPRMLFTTAEKLFLQKRFPAEILDLSDKETIFGRLVTARAMSKGKVLLSGAADTFSLRKIIERNSELGADLTIVDGALSRLSLASPATTDAMVLATGAALSSNIDTLVRKTKFICQMIGLDEFQEAGSIEADELQNGVYFLQNGKLHSLGLNSALAISTIDKDQLASLRESRKIFIIGILSNKILEFLIERKLAKNTILVVKDFSTIFITSMVYNMFCKLGGKIEVLKRTNLIAITVNPTSPTGIVLNSELLQARLAEATGVEVFDVKKV